MSKTSTPLMHSQPDRGQGSSSLSLPWSFVAEMSQCSAGLGNEFRAAALDEIAGFGDDVFQYFGELADAGLAVNDLRS